MRKTSLPVEPRSYAIDSRGLQRADVFQAGESSVDARELYVRVADRHADGAIERVPIVLLEFEREEARSIGQRTI